MQKILLEQAADGMVLAREIVSGEGRILCGRGTVLSAALLDRLQRMDITTVTVEGHPVADPDRKTPEQQIAEIEERFSRVDDIPALMRIKKRLVDRIKAQEDDGGG
ncbi:MAG: hypothetical protein AB1568_13360 [Thermodesulfobacteriota bacterium]